MQKFKSIIVFFLILFCISCKGSGQSELIKFETLSGKIIKPVTSKELPYDSITLTYTIQWPVKGNAEIVSLVQAQIINLITDDEDLNNEKSDIKNTLNSIATKMAQGMVEFSKKIVVEAEEETPFDSYLTIRNFVELDPYASRYVYSYAAISIRLTDGKIFPGNNAIANEDMMKALITKHLIKTYQSEDSDWLWRDHITCEQYKVPMPKTPLSLSKDGVLVHYDQYEIASGVEPPFECIIPFDEVIYALTEDAQEFLNITTNTTKEIGKTSATKESELDEDNAISLIKKANLHNSDALSTEFYELWDGWGTLLQYGAGIDCVIVKNPDIKIFKIIPNKEGTEITVIFDFIDKDAPHMGWVSQQDYNQKICAMSFINENGKWVVDDYFEAWDSTVDKFDKKEASSFKSNQKFMSEEADF